jgi:nitrite reductase (NADH) small subunit
MTALASETWTLVGRVDDIPLLEGRSTSVDGRRIAVFRLLDGFHAVDAACPHAGGPLADGIVADSCVTCPLHGRRFDVHTGLALNGDESVAVHDVRVDGNELWVRLAL